MNRSKLAFIVSLWTFTVNGALAQPKSIYEVSPVRDGSIIAAGILGSVLPHVFADKLIHPTCPCDYQTLNPIDRSVVGNSNSILGTVSDISLGVAVLLPPALDYYDLGPTQELIEDLAIYSEVLSTTAVLVTLAKYGFQRPRPLVYEGKDLSLMRDPEGYRSFYSGHSSFAFASLTAASLTLSLRQKHIGALPWLVTAAFGTTVALERVAAGKHFYSDVLVGAITGTAVGILVPWLHRRQGAKNSDHHFSFVASYDGFHVSLSRTF